MFDVRAIKSKFCVLLISCREIINDTQRDENEGALLKHFNQYLMHILSLVTDNIPSCIIVRRRMTIEKIS